METKYFIYFISGLNRINGKYDLFKMHRNILLKIKSLIFLPYFTIDEIPKEICYLKNLTYLACKHNNLTYISDEICNLNKLQILILSHNEINEISDNIIKLNNLIEFDIKFNNIKKIPKKICEFKKMEYFDYSYNYINTKIQKQKNKHVYYSDQIKLEISNFKNEKLKK